MCLDTLPNDSIMIDEREDPSQSDDEQIVMSGIKASFTLVSVSGDIFEMKNKFIRKTKQKRKTKNEPCVNKTLKNPCFKVSEKPMKDKSTVLPWSKITLSGSDFGINELTWTNELK